MKSLLLTIIVAFLLAAGFAVNMSGDASDDDAKIRRVLDKHNRSWGGPNIPEADGKALYDIIIKNKYKSALEIGTSNGYSGIWIAWALKKTGGRLITIEIDQGRHKEALAYFREAGLAEIIDARLGDAHKLVPALSGPFDFVFCDADKEWYENYLKDAMPKLSEGGCFAAHNVSEYTGRGMGGFGRGGPSGGYLEFARSIPNLETSVLNISGSSGLAVSYKKSK